MKPASDIMQRIHSAADNLFEQGGRATFPTVDAVRKAARVNMSDANSGMREWRQNQLARAVPAQVQVPAAIAEAQAGLVAQLWQAAQVKAGESLAAAQAAWEAERLQLESLGREIADAFEVQAVELNVVRDELHTCSQRADNATAACARLQMELEVLQARFAAVENEARLGAVRVEEVERRASALRRELDHAYQSLDDARAVSREINQKHADELLVVRADARKAADVLRQELEASRQQQRELMEILSGTTVAAMPGDASYNGQVSP